MNSIQKESILKIVMSQTNYDKDTAEQKLQEWDNDFIKVIKEFLNPNFEEKERKDKEEKDKVVSLNQGIMNELRKFKDKQNKNYDSHKKFKDYLKKSQEVQELNNYLSEQEKLKQQMLKKQTNKLESIPENNASAENNEPENIFL